MAGRRLGLGILFAVIFSFVLWAIIWFMLVNPNRPYIEMPHATGQFAGLAGFLYLTLYSAIFSVAIWLLMAFFLPLLMGAHGWEGPLAWVIVGAISAEAMVWLLAILFFVLSHVATMPALRLDGALINDFLWVVMAIPYGAVHAFLQHRKEFQEQKLTADPR